jgi:hypothetical protein
MFSKFKAALSSVILYKDQDFAMTADDVHYFGWADCTWSESEGLTRQEGESIDAFCSRVNQTSKKNFLWFE